jgi:hypothetical protein
VIQWRTIQTRAAHNFGSAMRKYWAHHAGSTGFGEPRLLAWQHRATHTAPTSSFAPATWRKATEVIALAITDLLC